MIHYIILCYVSIFDFIKIKSLCSVAYIISLFHSFIVPGSDEDWYVDDKFKESNSISFI